MAIILSSTGITFDNGENQSTAWGADRGRLISITSFTASGNYTVPSDCTNIMVELIGGGGGAAGYCESGGAGGYAVGTHSVTAGTIYAVTVGAGGTAVGYYAAAGDGGTSSFGALISATGGYGANRNYSHAGGHGGIGTLTGGSGTGHANGGSHSQTANGGGGFFGGPGGKTRSNDGANYGPAHGSGASGGIGEIGSTGSGTISGMVNVYAYK